MTRHSKVWRVVAALFVVANVGGGVVALVRGEPLHAGVHVALLGVGYVAWQLVPRTRRRGELAGAQAVEERLERLQQTLDVIAIEVERVGESQRFITRLQAERAQRSSGNPS